MKWLRRAVVLAFLANFAIFASDAQGNAPRTFAPFEEWRTAVLAGDKAVLASLYSTRPPTKIQVGKAANVENLEDELQFWTGLPSSGIMNVRLKVLSLETARNQTKLLLRVQAVKASQPVFANMAQIWVQQLDGWHLALSQRSDFYPDAARRLPEPTKPNPVLYPNPSQAQAQLPKGVTPELTPASPIDEIYRYTLRSPKDALGRDIYTIYDLKALQDWAARVVNRA